MLKIARHGVKTKSEQNSKLLERPSPLLWGCD